MKQNYCNQQTLFCLVGVAFNTRCIIIATCPAWLAVMSDWFNHPLPPADHLLGSCIGAASGLKTMQTAWKQIEKKNTLRTSLRKENTQVVNGWL